MAGVDKMRTRTVDRGPTKMWTFARGLLPLSPLYSKLTSPLCMTKKWTHNKILQKIKFELKYIFQLITYHSIIKGEWIDKLKWRDGFC